jgi:hypothetical protein
MTKLFLKQLKDLNSNHVYDYLKVDSSSVSVISAATSISNCGSVDILVLVGSTYSLVNFNTTAVKTS